MSMASYLYRIEKDGKDTICEIFDDEIHDKKYKNLYDTYKEYFIESNETLYNVEHILKDIESKYTVEMSDGEVHLDGYRVWVTELDEPILTQLNDIPTGEVKCYTLYGNMVRGINEPDKYKSHVYKNEHTYVVGKDEWDMVLKLFPKTDNIHKIDYEDDLVIVNNY